MYSPSLQVCKFSNCHINNVILHCIRFIITNFNCIEIKNKHKMLNFASNINTTVKMLHDGIDLIVKIDALYLISYIGTIQAIFCLYLYNYE